jgi:hypothetical protein
VDKRQGDDMFRAEITARGDVTTLELFGELDVVSMLDFETALSAVLMRRPRRLVFEISGAKFISGQGFAAIGRCSGEVESVAVRSRSGLAHKVLRALGHDEVECTELGLR